MSLEISVGRYETSAPLPDPMNINIRCTGPDEYVIKLDNFLLYASFVNLAGLQAKLTKAMDEVAELRKESA